MAKHHKGEIFGLLRPGSPESGPLTVLFKINDDHEIDEKVSKLSCLLKSVKNVAIKSSFLDQVINLGIYSQCTVVC